MGNPVAVVCLTGALLTSSPIAHAQDGAAATVSRAGVDRTPNVASGLPAATDFGADVRWPVIGGLSVELERSYHQGEVGALNLRASLLYDLATIGRLTPYFATGINLDQHATLALTPTGLMERGATTAAVNAGGGLRIRANDTWDARTDARWLKGLGSASSERWRVFSGVTFKSPAQR
ncbi:MAG: hypothetical protein U0Q11_22370 [Vicinamibacterales bacterium]